MKNNRARQFLPFNGLRGFTEQLKKQEELFEGELPLTDDEAESLNHMVPRLTRDCLIRIRYYHLNQYKTLQGYLQGIDTVHQILHLCGQSISFSHINKKYPALFKQRKLSIVNTVNLYSRFTSPVLRKQKIYIPFSLEIIR